MESFPDPIIGKLAVKSGGNFKISRNMLFKKKMDPAKAAIINPQRVQI